MGPLLHRLIETRNKIEQLLSFDPIGPPKPIEALLDTLPQLEKDLQNELKRLRAILPPTTNTPLSPSPQPATPGPFFAIFNEERIHRDRGPLPRHLCCAA